MASVTAELNLKCNLNVIILILNCHVWLLATVMDRESCLLSCSHALTPPIAAVTNFMVEKTQIYYLKVMEVRIPKIKIFLLGGNVFPCPL